MHPAAPTPATAVQGRAIRHAIPHSSRITTGAHTLKDADRLEDHHALSEIQTVITITKDGLLKIQLDQNGMRFHVWLPPGEAVELANHLWNEAAKAVTMTRKEGL